MQSLNPPDKVHVCRGLANSHDLTISLFYKTLKQVHVYESAVNIVDSELGFEQKAVLEDIDALESLDYSNGVTSGSADFCGCVKLISRGMLKKLG